MAGSTNVVAPKTLPSHPAIKKQVESYCWQIVAREESDLVPEFNGADAYMAWCHELPGTSGFGSSHAAALDSAKARVAEQLAERVDSGGKIPRAMKAGQRSVQVLIRMTLDEKRLLDANVSESGKSQNDYCCNKLLEKSGPALSSEDLSMIKDLPKLIQAMEARLKK